MEMSTPMQNLSSRLLILLLIAALSHFAFSDALQRKVHIPDELDDVVDEEEDEAWKQWGKPNTLPEFDPPPTDFTGMSIQEMNEKMLKHQFGPVFGFVKLLPGARRTPAKVSEIATKWSRVARTGSIEVKFSGVDLSTVMFTIDKGQDALELKEFLLSQTEAYEVKIGDQLFRRDGDPSFEEVVHKMEIEKSKAHESKHEEL